VVEATSDFEDLGRCHEERSTLVSTAVCFDGEADGWNGTVQRDELPASLCA